MRGFFSRTGQRYFTDKLEDESLARLGWMDIGQPNIYLRNDLTMHNTQDTLFYITKTTKFRNKNKLWTAQLSTLSTLNGLGSVLYLMSYRVLYRSTHFSSTFVFGELFFVIFQHSKEEWFRTKTQI